MQNDYPENAYSLRTLMIFGPDTNKEPDALKQLDTFAKTINPILKQAQNFMLSRFVWIDVDTFAHPDSANATHSEEDRECAARGSYPKRFLVPASNDVGNGYNRTRIFEPAIFTDTPKLQYDEITLIGFGETSLPQMSEASYLLQEQGMNVVTRACVLSGKNNFQTTAQTMLANFTVFDPTDDIAAGINITKKTIPIVADEMEYEQRDGYDWNRLYHVTWTNPKTGLILREESCGWDYVDNPEADGSGWPIVDRITRLGFAHYDMAGNTIHSSKEVIVTRDSGSSETEQLNSEFRAGFTSSPQGKDNWKRQDKFRKLNNDN